MKWESWKRVLREGGEYGNARKNSPKGNRFGILGCLLGLPPSVIHFWKAVSGTTFLSQILQYVSIFNRLKVIELQSVLCSSLYLKSRNNVPPYIFRKICSRATFASQIVCLYFALLWAPAQRKRATMLYFANVFFLIFFYGRLILRPWLTEVRESFTCGGP